MQQTKTVDHGLWQRRGERYLDLLMFFSPERVLSDLGTQLLSDIKTKTKLYIIVSYCIYVKVHSNRCLNLVCSVDTQLFP